MTGLKSNKIPVSKTQKSRFPRRYWLPLLVLLGLGSIAELLTRIGGEILWFQEVNYLRVFGLRSIAQVVLFALVFALSTSYLWGNLALARWLKSEREGGREGERAKKGKRGENSSLNTPHSTLNTSQTPNFFLPLGFRWLLGLTLGLSLSIALLVIHYGQVTVSQWQVNPTSAPVVFAPESIWHLMQQVVSQVWFSILLLGIAALIAIYPQQVLRAIALVLSVLFGLVISRQWGRVLPYFYATPFQQQDPVFSRDISFYIFALPVWELLEFWLIGLCWFGFAAVTLSYLLSGRNLSEGRFPGFSASQQRHLTGLGSIFMLVVSFSYWIGRYQLLYSPRGVSYGASYTDINVQLPAYTGLSLLSLAIAIYLGWRMASGPHPLTPSLNIGRRGKIPPLLAEEGRTREGARTRKGIEVLLPSPHSGRGVGGEGKRPIAKGNMLSQPLVYGLGLYIAIAITTTSILPAIVQSLLVEPNELERERPYIQRTIALTRQAFALDRIDTQPFNPQGQLTAADLEANRLTVRNIRLWDREPLLETNRQLQQIRPYYRFPDADIDRYTFVGEEKSTPPTLSQQQVLIAARELDYNAVPEQAQTWLNRSLIYTHGYGFTMSPVNRVGPGGLPEYFVKDIGITEGTPLTTSSEAVRASIPIGQPRIYYGEMTNTYVMTGTKVRELDYPSGEENVYNTYDGSGGVNLGPFWRRALFANYLRDWRLLITPELQPQTKLLFRRNIDRRIRAIAPFLQYDSDPYLVAAEGEKERTPSYLYWIVDAYTTSDRYPYSDVGNEGLNYIRNSVKVVIDAYNGSVNFYIADSSDPMIKTWSAIFPDLFKPLSEMPASLRSHIRYPVDFFKMQAKQLMDYHMTDPQVFYNREDRWQIPNEVYGDKPRLVEPYYLITSLPTVPFEEFILLLPYTPKERTNLIAWLAARSDTENYGKLLLYVFPKQQLVYGPEQIEARINQDPVISQQISLWNRQGSRAIQGNLLIVPIERSLLYVEPLYLESTQNRLPTLIRVIVAYENRIVMANTLEQGLQAIFQPEKPASPPIVRPVEEP
ncbi:MAG: UPF0182 family protein [Cyanosarcina radialis HA8281-LM2]|jgi:hypothetical protein|nr:UPF0182 family protein [Cyanosarcina radialis HA8281-LM2]